MNWFQIVASADIDQIQTLIPTFSTSRDQFQRTALMLASSRGLQNVVEILAPYESTLQDANGITASMYGAARGYYYNDLLIEQTIQSNNGFTALMYATISGSSLAVTKFLKEKNIISKEGYTASQLALCLGNLTIFNQINENCGKITNLMAAAVSEEEVGRFSQFLQHQDAFNRSSLWFSLDAGNLKMSEHLLTERDFSDKNNTTMLMKAAESGLQTLLPYFVNQLKSVDNDGKTALMYAAANNNSNCINELISEISMQDNSGKTASMYAAENGHVECLALLITEESIILDKQNRHLMHYVVNHAQNNAILPQIVQNFQNNVDLEGKSSLIYACECDNFAAVSFLLQYEKDTLPPTQNTPSMHAALSNSVHSIDVVAETFKKRKNAKGETAIDLALQNDAGKVVPVLLQRDFIQNVMLRACAANKFQVVKVISDVARFGSSKLTNFIYNVQQQQICKKELESLTKKFLNFTDNIPALFVAIQAGSSECVRVLIKSQSNVFLKDGTTPLMFYIKCDSNLDSKAENSLILANSGKQLKDGTSALMMASFKGTNLGLIRNLVKFEKNLLNKEGKRAIEFANSDAVLKCLE